MAVVTPEDSHPQIGHPRARRGARVGRSARRTANGAS